MYLSHATDEAKSSFVRVPRNPTGNPAKSTPVYVGDLTRSETCHAWDPANERRRSLVTEPKWLLHHLRTARRARIGT